LTFDLQTEDGKWVVDEEQTVRLKANYVISAFGSELSDTEGWSAINRCAGGFKVSLPPPLPPSSSPSLPPSSQW